MHFKILDQAPADYEQVKTDEKEQLHRERVRLWYVAITRACDLLLLPRQSERKPNDWMSVVDLRLDDLPTFDPRAIVYAPVLPAVDEPENTQDETSWRGEADTIAATRRAIVWRSPSRHEGSPDASPLPERDEIFSDAAAFSEQLPTTSDTAAVASAVRGSRERGLVIHKLLEEVLTGETADGAGSRLKFEQEPCWPSLAYRKPPGPKMARIPPSWRRRPCGLWRYPRSASTGAG